MFEAILITEIYHYVSVFSVLLELQGILTGSSEYLCVFTSLGRSDRAVFWAIPGISRVPECPRNGPIRTVKTEMQLGLPLCLIIETTCC